MGKRDLECAGTEAAQADRDHFGVLNGRCIPERAADLEVAGQEYRFDGADREELRAWCDPDDIGVGADQRRVVVELVDLRADVGQA